MSAAFLVMLGVFLLAGAIGMPIAFAMLVAGITYLFATGQDVGLAAEQILNGLYNSFVLLAVPLFIFAANVMNAGTVSDRLLAFCLAVVGRLRGGLAHVNVVASLIFSGMSGSAIADAAGIGKVIIEMMTREGRYSPGFAAAITAASATIGPIIPPSIPMVLYALISGTSVGFLFLGGVVPGFLMASFLMAAVSVIARRRDFPVEAKVPVREMPAIVGKALPPLMLPVILLGGIYGGVTTPTEAASIAAAYALLLAAVVYRALGPGQVIGLLVDSSRTTAMVALIIGGAFVFNYVVATERIPNVLASWLAGQEISPLAFLLVVNLLFLLFGCLLDATTMLLVLVPLLLPTCRQLGIDLIHFGVVIVVNIMIGLITPPYGVLLFVINGITGISLRDMIREIWPFLFILIAALITMVVFPESVLWLPRQFGYKG
jgi:tripartite ATP-independent transporter DctM subunit